MDNKLKSNNNFIVDYKETSSIVDDIQNIIDSAQRYAHKAINTALVQRNWLIGYRIAEEELKGEDRAEYGMGVIKSLSNELTKIYGKGFTKTNLYSFYSFYKSYSDIFHTPCGKCQILLSWSHYRVLLQVHDK